MAGGYVVGSISSSPSSIHQMFSTISFNHFLNSWQGLKQESIHNLFVLFVRINAYPRVAFKLLNSKSLANFLTFRMGLLSECAISSICLNRLNWLYLRNIQFLRKFLHSSANSSTLMLLNQFSYSFYQFTKYSPFLLFTTFSTHGKGLNKKQYTSFSALG